MGNHICTSLSPLSLEHLEALAHAPSLLDIILEDTPGSTGCQRNAVFRKELMRADLERQFTGCDTSLHALRCVRDRSGTLHRICGSPRAVSRLPGAGEQRSALGQGRSRRREDKSCVSLGASPGSHVGGPTGALRTDPHGFRDSTLSDLSSVSDNGGVPAAAARRAASSSPKSKGDFTPQCSATGRTGLASARPVADVQLSPHSWLFREVSVQPVDLNHGVELRAAEVYILIVVQRATMLGTPLTSTSAVAPSTDPSRARVSTPLPSVLTNSDVSRAGLHSSAMGSHAHTEWSRDMVQLFTPRGLSTPFSSDMTRPTLTKGGRGLGAGFLGSLYSTPRTNGSTSGRPTPRSTTNGAGPGGGGDVSGYLEASPRSISSQATPRASDFHFSVHLLTGKQADAITAAAGLVTARTIEKLFLECADFDRRLFHNVNPVNIDSIIHGCTTGATCSIIPGQRGSGTELVNPDGDKNITSSPQSPTTSAGAAASLTRLTGNTTSLATSDSNSGFNDPKSPLQHPKSPLEIPIELWQQVLAVTRPASVAVPKLRSVTGATLTSSLVSASSEAGELRSGSEHVAGTVVSCNLAELYSANAIFRVLSGVRLGTPRWVHHSDVVSPLNSARYSLPISGSTVVACGSSTGADPLGTNACHFDPLPSLRSSRRSFPGDGTATGLTSIPPLSISSWLQGPQPLDVHHAAPASSTATGSGVSTQPIKMGSMTPRIGKPGRCASDHASASSASLPPPPPPPIPMLMLGSLSGNHRVGGTTLLDGVGAPSNPFSSSAGTLRLPLNALSTPFTATPHATASAMLRRDTADESIGNASPSSPSEVPVSPLRPLLYLEGEGVTEAAVQPTGNSLLEVKDSSLFGGQEAVMQAGARRHGRDLEHTLHEHRSEDVGGEVGAEKTGVEHIAAEEISARLTVAASSSAIAVGDEDYDEVQTQQERAQRLKAAQPEVTEILPRLFVGGEDAARDRAQLLRKGVTHVVNTVSWCLDSFYPDLFRYLRLNLSDATDEPIFSLFAIVNAFIEDALERHNGRVFVHCQQGVSRSCTFIIAYIMWKQGLCYDRAYEFVRERRKVCNPNLGFYMNLRLWEAQLSRPMLNSVFAYAPYTSPSPLPFSYQLTAYFDCETSSTVCAAAPSCSAPSNPESPWISGERQAPGLLSPRDKEVYQQLRSDVLTRATDMGGESSASPRTLSLDPRLGYLFLFAPVGQAADEVNRFSGVYTEARRSVQRSRQRPRLSRGADVDPGEGVAGERDTNVVTGCVVMGPECLGKLYSERALVACRRMLRFSFYHGEPRTSITNSGKEVHFYPMLQVRLLPAISMALLPRSSSLFPVPGAAMSLELTQRLLSIHISNEVRIGFARQSQWDVFFSNPRLGAMLSHDIEEENRLDSCEVVRRHAREKALKGGINASRSSRPITGYQTTSTSPATMLPTPFPLVSPAAPRSSSSRSGRQHTPRISRQMRVPFYNRGSSFQRAGEGDRTTLHAAASVGTSSAQIAQFVNDDVNESGAAAALSPASTACQPSNVSLLPTDSPVTTAARTPKTVSLGISLPLIGIPGLVLESVTASGGRSRSSSPSDGIRSRESSTPATVRMADGDSFAFIYPFTAATKVLVSDLDDLEEDRCYVLGFQQRTCTSIYLWRGAYAVESVTDVVHTFVQRMLFPSEPQQCAAVVHSLEAGKWTSCRIKIPDTVTSGVSSADTLGKVSNATESLVDVHVLYVEQGDEPKEFFTLL